jgi:hypothetical protein
MGHGSWAGKMGLGDLSANGDPWIIDPTTLIALLVVSPVPEH